MAVPNLQKIKTEVETINNSVIKGLETLGAEKSIDNISWGDIGKFNFNTVTKPTVSSKNGYNASLSFSRKNTNVHIGFSKSITFGDSYSIRQEERERPIEPIKHNTLVSSDTASFTLGSSNSTTHSKFKKSKQFKEIYSLQKGQSYRSYTKSSFYSRKKLILNGIYYKDYTTKTTLDLGNGAHLSFNTGFMHYDIRLVRVSTYTLNFNTNHFLASSRIVHVFLTVLSNNTFGKWITNKLYSERKGLSKFYGTLYSNTSGGTVDEKTKLLRAEATNTWGFKDFRATTAAVVKNNEKVQIK